MPAQKVDRHLDTSCPGSPQPQPQPTISPSLFRGFVSSAPATKPPDRLPALSYSVLKEAALKKKMNELGLSVSGTRPQIERRHQEWVTLWNANCDSLRPKKRS